MIDFRYHLVSIVAVFLALAIGIVVGATALKPKTLAGLDRASRLEQQEISSQRSELKSLHGQIGSDQALAQAAAPRLLANLLEGQRVVLVTAPGADGATVAGVSNALKQAGAKVTAQVQLQPTFFDTSAGTQNSLNVLAQKVAPPSVTPGPQATAPQGADPQITGQQEAAQVLAPALVTNDNGDLPAAEAGNVLSGFAQQGFLQLVSASGTAPPPQATLAVVVTPASPPPSGDSDPANLALIYLAEQLKLASRGVVMAGSLPGSGQGSAIDELINGNTGTQVSTVDNANTEIGQIMVGWALSSLLAGHKPASYGVDTGTVPSPGPSRSASPLAPAASAGTKNKSRA